MPAKLKVTGGVLIATLLIGVVYYLVSEDFFSQRCLNENEKAVFEVLEEGRPGKVRVSVVDTTSSSTVWSRDADIPSTTAIDIYAARDCHYYLHERKGFDPKTGKISPGYYWSLLQYKYFSNDEAKRVVLFIENSTGKREDSRPYYGATFSIDPSDRYISLERSSLGKLDYALVIKEIEGGKDVFELKLADVLKKYPQVAGSFDVGTWYEKRDGLYLYGDIYDGSRWAALWSVKAGMWDVEFFPTPDDYQPGVERSAPFGNNDHLAYTDLIVWAGGVREVEDELLNEALAEGRRKNLFVANLRTGKKVTVATVPIVRGHRFNPTWISDTELEYTMPDGTKKRYIVSE